MKEQDYMNLMGTIRGEYLEEAVSWDGSERRRIRQIRRMTVSFGAVAAALAIVVGMIAYKEQKQKIPTADSVPESSTVSTPDESSAVVDHAQQINLFGGYGELHPVRGRNGIICYDNDYIYEFGDKWALHSGGRIEHMGDGEWPEDLYQSEDGFFRIHDNKLFETDSFGNETELMNFAAYSLPIEPSAKIIRQVGRLGDRMIALMYMDGTTPDYKILIVDLQTGTVAEQPDSSYAELFPDSETGYYALSLNSASMGAVKHYELVNGALKEEQAAEKPDADYVINSATIRGQKLYYYGIRSDGSDNFVVRDLRTGDTTETAIDAYSNLYVSDVLIHTEIKNEAFSIYKSTLDFENEELIFSVPIDLYLDTSLYGVPKQNKGFDMLYASDDLVISQLPFEYSESYVCPTRHGEEYVLIDLHTGKALYFGKNYDMGQEPESTSAAPVVTVTAAETSGTAATTVLTTDTAAVTTTVASSMTEEQRKALAKELIRNYCYSVESLAYGSSDNLDISDMREVAEANAFGGTDQIQYARVKGMHSIAEIRQEMQKHVTGAAYEELISFMEGRAGSCAGKPVYREFDGKLYSNIMGKGAEFMGWLWDTMTVEQITENGFTVTVKEESYGGDIIIHRFECTDLQDGTDHSFRVSRHTEEDTGKTLSGEPVS